MKVIGMIRPHEVKEIEAEGADYDQAREKLLAIIPGGLHAAERAARFLTVSCSAGELGLAGPAEDDADGPGHPSMG